MAYNGKGYKHKQNREEHRRPTARTGFFERGGVFNPPCEPVNRVLGGFGRSKLS